jgi:hypothetical protein
MLPDSVPAVSEKAKLYRRSAQRIEGPSGNGSTAENRSSTQRMNIHNFE